MKTCVICCEAKELDEFANNPSSKDGKSNKCKPCFREQVRSRYTVGDRRRHHLWYRYKLTPEAYDALYESRNGVCDICGNNFEILHIDHDHSCCASKHKTCGNCIRGLLCGSCNRALGLMKDRYDSIEKMLQYIKRENSSF